MNRIAFTGEPGSALLLEEAIRFATTMHCGQLDKQEQPYILHPIAVMMRVGSVVEKTVAVLHDIIEDTVFTRESLIAAGLDARVAKHVHTLSRSPSETYKEYIKRVGEGGRVAIKVKIADLEHNMDPSRPKGCKMQGLQKRYEKAYNYLNGLGWNTNNQVEIDKVSDNER